jgi:hypothetical protein
MRFSLSHIFNGFPATVKGGASIRNTSSNKSGFHNRKLRLHSRQAGVQQYPHLISCFRLDRGDSNYYLIRISPCRRQCEMKTTLSRDIVNLSRSSGDEFNGILSVVLHCIMDVYEFDISKSVRGFDACTLTCAVPFEADDAHPDILC